MTDVDAEDWDIIEDWWQSYGEFVRQSGEELLEKLTNLHKEIQLATDKTESLPPFEIYLDDQEPFKRLPEEGWTHWIEVLLNLSGGLFPQNLAREFLTDQSPNEFVIETTKREKSVQKEDEHDRRGDLIVYFKSGDVWNIEVKKGDEHYKKTFHAAKLLEDEIASNRIQHFLLLPRDKMKQVAENKTDEEEQDQGTEKRFRNYLKTVDDLHNVEIPQELIEEIDKKFHLIYWEDIVTALYKTLYPGLFVDSAVTKTPESDSWKYIASLYCRMIEKEIFGFQSRKGIKKQLNTSDYGQIEDMDYPAQNNFADKILRSVI